MSDQFSLRLAESDEKIKQVCGLTAEAFAPFLKPEQAGDLLLQAIKKDTENKSQVFYMEQKKTGKPVCMAIVVRTKGFYKDADKSAEISSTPDPELFGVKHVTIMKITTVVTATPYRNLGLANKLIEGSMKYVEGEILKHHLEESANNNKKDNFAKMVTDSEGAVDKRLAQYYLGKKYFWILYSGVGTFYERFGFKAYPVEFYKIPTSIVEHQKPILETLLGVGQTNPMAAGKKLRLLDSTNPQDRDLVSFVLQGKELEILTELNKLIFHSELSGGRKSSSSLTNMTELLSMTKISSNSDLTSISEAPKSAAQQASVSGGRRKSSIQYHSLSKVAVKPSSQALEISSFLRREASKHLESKTEESEKFDKIEGAIFTNDLQQKSHYILWANIATHLVIIAVGELQFNMFGVMADPMGKGGHKPRRGSSFTGLNELGGYNFQDLDILFSIACLVCQKRNVEDKESVYVAVNDLPNSIPAPMLNDYFLNYLPKAFDAVESSESDATNNKVELITDAADRLKILPMLRKYGQDKGTYDIDWIANGMWSYG